jgi:hypothetical protein
MWGRCRVHRGSDRRPARRCRRPSAPARYAIRLLAVLAVSAFAPVVPTTAQTQAKPPDRIGAVVERVQRIVETGEPGALAALAAPNTDPASLTAFENRWVTNVTSKVTMLERDRADTATGTRVLVEALVEAGMSGRLATWLIDLEGPADTEPRITRISTVSSVEGLFRLSLDSTKQYRVTNLHITAEDLDLSVPRGTAFVATVGGGTTAMVVLGRGEIAFTPAPETERGQMKLLTGIDSLRTSFDNVFIRVPPNEFDSHVTPSALEPMNVDPSALKSAQNVFNARVGRSFSVDLGDLSTEPWSLLPTTSDFLAEIPTRRFGTLTYAHSTSQPEDITLFNRDERHNLSVYASKSRLAARGPFYNEDDEMDYDVLDYNVDVQFTPERLWLEGRGTVKLRVRSYVLGSITLRLAGPLQVRSVVSDTFGRLLPLRVRNQETLVVNLPTPLSRGAEITLTVSYGGRLEPQHVDREALGLGQAVPREEVVLQPEPSWIYSNQAYWYPQGTFTDYATAQVRMSVPRGFGVVCSGDPAGGSPVTVKTGNTDPRLMYVFAATQPVRYVGCLISRFVTGDTQDIRLGSDVPTDPDARGIAHYNTVKLRSETNVRQRPRTREMVEHASEIISFYSDLLHDAPYPSFTLGIVESDLPGGHSPAYFAALQMPLPGNRFGWRDDPASFENYPEFFLAHEVAHQWWGHGVGWRNYHEQWLSEGFAQYFAAMYAEHLRGRDVFDGIIRTMSRWAVNTSDQGPVYLGYRLGHVRGDSKILRAVVYNKGAMVLHMLRRLVGDEPFFRGLRRFYDENRFQKAGTDGLRLAFEAETGRSLSRFFDRWIYGQDLPALTWTTRTEGTGEDQAVVIRFDQGSRVFDVPVTVSVQLSDGSFKDVVVPVTEQVVEQRIPVTGKIRAVRVNRDRAALLAERD